jgi:hypothetical protein
MRYAALFLLLLSLTSCQDDDDTVPPCFEGFQISEAVALPRGGVITLVDVVYEPCPCDVICFWQGAIGAVFLVEGQRDTLYQAGNYAPKENAGPLDNLIILGRDTVELREVNSGYECPTRSDIMGLREEDFCVTVDVR